MDLESRFTERPVFATGADGFVGSYLTEQLVVYEKFNETTGWEPGVSWREEASRPSSGMLKTGRRGTYEWVGSNRILEYKYVN
jgi:hypothetical protein